LVITTTRLPEGWAGDLYDTTLMAAGGEPPYMWDHYEALPAGLTLDRPSGRISGTPLRPFDLSVGFSVFDSHGLSTHRYLRLRIIGRLSLTTSRLPAGKLNAPYRVSLDLFGGTAPFVWSIASGRLPPGLYLNTATGEITGTPTAEENQTFTVQVTDTGPPVQTTSRTLTLQISRSLGRNDSIATATPISNGLFHASLSPFADPIDGPPNPDNDYYQLTANPGTVVTVETLADRLSAPSPADTVIEILDASGARFSTCRIGAGYPFNEPCMNDDIRQGSEMDSRLEFQVPGTSGDPVTFYVHVLDWSGSARPDFLYDLQVSGAN
jgi:hypothetical protein